MNHKKPSIANLIVSVETILNDVMKLGANTSKEYANLVRLRSLYSKIKNLLSDTL